MKLFFVNYHSSSSFFCGLQQRGIAQKNDKINSPPVTKQIIAIP
jgi:hypothetical protein